MDNRDTDALTLGGIIVATSGVITTVIRRYYRARTEDRDRRSGVDSEVRLSYKLALESLRDEIRRMRDERVEDRKEIDALREQNAELKGQVAMLEAHVAALSERLAAGEAA